MAMEIITCEQNSPEWFEARRGLPTSSEFDTVLSKGKDRKTPGATWWKYLYRLAAEIATGEVTEHYMNRDMERGHRLEPEARSLYRFMTDHATEQVGFVRNDAIRAPARVPTR